MRDTLTKVATYLRMIEKMAAKGDLEGIARDARLALKLCEKGKE
ncbi:hypothetical protein [Halovulum sp. GXIMD14793]